MRFGGKPVPDDPVYISHVTNKLHYEISISSEKMNKNMEKEEEGHEDEKQQQPQQQRKMEVEEEKKPFFFVIRKVLPV